MLFLRMHKSAVRFSSLDVFLNFFFFVLALAHAALSTLMHREMYWNEYECHSDAYNLECF